MPAVRVLQDGRVSYNYGIHFISKGDEIPAGEFADHLLATTVDLVEEADPDGPGVDTDGDGVPEGSAKQVLEWVGTDPARAAAALEAEEARPKPRSTLVDELHKRVQ
jgi:hypothetical protein